MEAVASTETLRAEEILIKNQLCSFESYLRSLQNAPNKLELSRRLKQLEADYAEYCKLRAKLAFLAGFAIDYEDMGTRFMQAALSAKLLLASSSTTDSDISIADQDAPCVENLPRFDGKFEDWPDFKTKFSSMIDNQDGLCDAQKLQYLQSALSYEAAKVIKAMGTTDGSYRQVWQKLEDTYASERRTVMRLVDLLVETPPLTEQTGEELRDFANHVQHHLQLLVALNVRVGYWDALLCGILLPKLDPRTRAAFNVTLFRDEEVPRIDTLLKFLTRRAWKLGKMELLLR